MSDEKKNLPENTEQHGTDDDREIDSSAVGVGLRDLTQKAARRHLKRRLERIAAEHEVPIERDPEDAQAKAEGSSPDKDRDISGGDTKEEEDDSVEPPD
jgi:hypothetical protein